jgi:HPt (histidine-containing phosphotransfer) domain-containing protein
VPVPEPEPGPTSPRAAVTAARLEVLRRLGPADGWGLLPRVIESFLTSSPAQLAELRTADAATAETTAHRLRGAAGNLGAERLAELCAEAEELAAGGAALPAQLLDHLDQELADVCAELERVVAS